MSDSDKYPADSGRRRFVKGVVGGAALAGVGTTGAAAVNSATSSTGSGGGPTQAYAIENTGGPAPRGMPQIPIEIDDEGYIRGVWPEVQTVTQNGVEVELAITEDYQGTGVTYSQDWFQYCGVQSYEALSPSFESDNYFRSDNGAYDWQSETYSAGDRLNVNDFDEYESWGNGIGQSGLGQPATGTWRSQDTEDTIPIQVLRSTRIEEAAQDNEWLAASTDQGVIAWLNKCTHFCCVPGYKQAASSATFGGEDGVYCQCHQSVYDPFSIVETLFTALPRPSE
ncbi:MULTISPECIES: cytochrome bc1 complex Rieske iron-sulfur protein [Haloferax]|jgi:Rieske Fe-S protein|uniref:Ubiquinol-cytochrome c reductase iron-sulfur subunit n=4 Tax=Haloferax TaxID=2251 RepID=A0A6C0UWZ2_HALVO|nr:MULTISPECIES: cytochrome bc1 complex Rieske iron-sulfur protein [Haloferax]ELK56023.1 cytochrome bc1 complex Rieske iron-sulfur protein [Haloferax sp. BAB-2207]ELZ76791.1 cytochrome bc1 complex Rieske iron-sulfur protein [Haloferax lucentense DSM 14919]ELZ86250.1 cytochrome bc1 complex Rieske iron-sulfur protein [Haloferax alexandrinus JCM 10717]MBC9987302.1 ubiquinol-cytochrome c reductase iron-sulfur subunit [Haloferax sp. AS1]NLV04231.1 ubiquinol-cytochrome c reductase iron-sulfur subuni